MEQLSFTVYSDIHQRPDEARLLATMRRALNNDNTRISLTSLVVKWVETIGATRLETGHLTAGARKDVHTESLRSCRTRIVDGLLKDHPHPSHGCVLITRIIPQVTVH